MPTRALLGVAAASDAAAPRDRAELQAEIAQLQKELAATREQLARTQCVDTAGALAGSIAHDLNNVLTPILLSIALLDEQLVDSESRRLLGVLEQSAQRGATMLRQILTYARGIQQSPPGADARQIVEDLRRVLADSFPHSIQISVEMASDLSTISIDPMPLHHALVYLCTAARNAMLGGGYLTLRAENVTVDEQRAALAGVRAGAFVMITVSATGRLADVDGIGTLGPHGGFITVESIDSGGSAARLYVPASTAAVNTATTDDLHALHGRDELILLVGDEASLWSITAHLLTTNGYRAVTATNGTAAVAEFGRTPRQIAAVIADVTAPGMHGTDTLRALHTIDADVPLIAATDVASGGDAFGTESGVVAVLQKPLGAQALLRTLRAALDK